MVKKTTYPIDKLLKLLSPLSINMTSEQQKKMLSLCSMSRLKKTEVICHEGDIANRLFCIMEGSAMITMKVDSEHEQIVRLLKSGDYYGYREYFLDNNYITSFIAISDVMICSIPMDYILNCVNINKNVAMFFIRQMSGELFAADVRFVKLTQKHLRGKLADVLLYLTEYFGLESDGKTLTVCLSRKELANIAIMTTANAIRTLSAFALDGLIEVKQRKISILDIPALRYISLHD